MDCDTTRDHGCQGGLMDFAFDFIIQNGGLDSERDYKYKAQQATCNLNKEKRHVVTIDDYEDVPPNDEKALEKARPFVLGRMARNAYACAVYGRTLGFCSCARCETGLSACDSVSLHQANVSLAVSVMASGCFVLASTRQSIARFPLCPDEIWSSAVLMGLCECMHSVLSAGSATFLSPALGAFVVLV